MKVHKLIFLIVLFSAEVSIIFAQQSIFHSDRKEGIYNTKEEFIQNKPTEKIAVKIDKIELVNDTSTLARRCFIVDANSGKRIKRVFAICDDGFIYFNTKAILENRNKDDNSVSPVESKSSFVRVLIGGDHFLYAEGAFHNVWQSSFPDAVSSGVGGVPGDEVGKAIAKSYPKTTFGGTGLVWDIDKKEFNIFRNCDDFNLFIIDKTEESINCGKHEFKLTQIRDIICLIK